MKQYIDAVRDVLETGEWSDNRTGIRTLFKLGLSMKFDLADGFPLLTTKKVNWRSCFAEMLGFLRGYDNAADFRKLGSKVWDANANMNEQWLNNPARLGTDDLGRVYGVQARRWNSSYEHYDQLRKVYDHLRLGVDDRREIVSHWNPGELEFMALPPCHMFYQFGLHGFDQQLGPASRGAGRTLDLFIYVRSNDIGLGMPYNIAGYAWLLSVMAQITGHVPGTLHYFAFNYHIYENHVEPLKEQLLRTLQPLPRLIIHPRCSDLKFLEETTLPIQEWCSVAEYNPWPSIKMNMAV